MKKHEYQGVGRHDEEKLEIYVNGERVEVDESEDTEDAKDDTTRG